MAKETTQKSKKVAHRKTFSGVVVSDKMKDTAVVKVERYTKHPKYRKYLRSSKRYQAHDLGNAHKVGEKVQIEETRPISRHKHFRII